jgi:hypothetical protein
MRINLIVNDCRFSNLWSPVRFQVEAKGVLAGPSAALRRRNGANALDLLLMAIKSRGGVT